MAATRKKRRRRNPGGEFMVLNPRRRRRRSAAPKARRRRRNPTAFALNPRRRRRAGVRRRRNPGGFMRAGKGLFGIPLGGAVGIVAGALAVKAASNLASRFIPLPEGPIKKYGTQAIATIAATFLARKFAGPKIANLIAQGGAVSILMGVANEYVTPRVPLLAEYEFGGGAGTLMEYLPGGDRAVREVPMLSDGSMWQSAI